MAAISVASYIQYKKDTSVFLVWLDEASQKHAPRLKGKARLEAKKAADESTTSGTAAPKQVTLSTEQILHKIDLILNVVGTPKAEVVPNGVQQALLRCINARERFTSWYQRSGPSTDEPSDRTHQYFIQVLKKALALFQHEEHRSSSTTPQSKANEKDEVFVTNMFKNLRVEDTRVTTNPEKDSMAKDPSTSERSTRTSANAEIGSEQTKKEIDFAVYSLFEDIHRIRAETQKIWYRLKSGELSIVHATLLIATALDLVRQAEAQTLEVWTSSNFAGDFDKEFQGKGGSYPAFMHRIYDATKLEAHKRKRAHRPEDVQQIISLLPTDEFVMLPLGYTLVDFSYLNECLYRNDHTRYHYLFVAPTELKTVNADGLVIPDDAQTLKAKEDDKFIMEIMLEVRFLQQLSNGQYRPTPYEVYEGFGPPFLPFRDILHNALRPVWEDHNVSVAAVFAARLLVDMHDTCGPIGTFVQSRAAEVHIERSIYLVDKYNSDDTEYLEWPGDNTFKEMVDEIRRRITCDLTPTPLWREVKTVAIRVIKDKRDAYSKEETEFVNTLVGPNEDITFLIDSNLLYGGNALVDLIAMLEIAGVKIASRSFSILCMAHVYNAVKQLGQLNTIWPEMDQVIELQGATIFANNIPTTRDDMRKRFRHAVGLSTGERLRQRNFKCTDAAHMIGSYFDGRENLARLIYRLESEFAGGESHVKRGKGTAKKKSSKASAPVTSDGTRQLAIQKLLHDLEKYLDAMLPAMNFDYIALTKTCSHMLSSLRQELSSYLGVEYDHDIKTQRVQCRWEVVYQMLEENYRVSVVHNIARHQAKKNKDEAAMQNLPEEAPMGQQLELAAKFLRKFLVDQALATRT